jgi:hypothetical protein
LWQNNFRGAIIMGRTRLHNSDAEKEAAYRSRLKDKDEKLRQLKLSFDSYIQDQLDIEDSKRVDRTKCIWDAMVDYSEDQIKTNYLKAINREPLDFGMSYFMLQNYICKNVPYCSECYYLSYRFETRCPNCGGKLREY